HLEGGGRIDGGRLIDIRQEQLLKNGGTRIYGQAKLLDTHTVEVDNQVLTAVHSIFATGAWLPHILVPVGLLGDVGAPDGHG
ncbi:FAD-binding oxidoreductase, partial [Streptococcus suis]